MTGHESAKHAFAISVKDFMVTYTLDVRKVMKHCVGSIIAEGKRILSCSYNNSAY